MYQSLQPIPFRWARLIIIPFIVFAGIIALFVEFDIDKQLAYFLSHQPGGFPYANSDSYEFWFHFFPKRAISGPLFVAMLTLAIALIPFATWLEKISNTRWQKIFSRFTQLNVVCKSRLWLASLPKGTRAALWLTVIAIVFSMEMIGHLKRASNVYCPITIQVYGGSEVVPLDTITEPFPTFAPHGGQCWPGGHSITGFIFEACFFGFYLLGMRRAAWTSLLAALVYGNFLGLTQVLRGQHYLSHQLWSSILCWYFSIVIFWLAEKFNHYRQSKLMQTTKL